MAAKNHYMNQLAVEVLDVQPDDQVLEIGFGPGRAIEMVAAGMTDGIVAGIDHSEVMLRQAARRNRKFIEARRPSCARRACRAPYVDARFTQDPPTPRRLRHIRTQGASSSARSASSWRTGELISVRGVGRNSR
jgi:SAM-dependent methyltransferase